MRPWLINVNFTQSQTNTRKLWSCLYSKTPAGSHCPEGLRPTSGHYKAKFNSRLLFFLHILTLIFLSQLSFCFYLCFWLCFMHAFESNLCYWLTSIPKNPYPLRSNSKFLGEFYSTWPWPTVLTPKGRPSAVSILMWYRLCTFGQPHTTWLECELGQLLFNVNSVERVILTFLTLSTVHQCSIC